MDRLVFEKVDPLIDDVAEAVGEVLKSSDVAPLRKFLGDLGKVLGDKYSVSLGVTVELFDREKERCLPILQMGLSGFGEGEPYQTTGDSTPQRYVVDGEIQVVPHDRCPKCWKTWDFKFRNPTCRECGASLGVDVKILLDSDVCPNCEAGRVSMANPICPRCGYEVVLRYVTWG